MRGVLVHDGPTHHVGGLIKLHTLHVGADGGRVQETLNPGRRRGRYRRGRGDGLMMRVLLQVTELAGPGERGCWRCGQGGTIDDGLAGYAGRSWTIKQAAAASCHGKWRRHGGSGCGAVGGRVRLNLAIEIGL